MTDRTRNTGLTEHLHDTGSKRDRLARRLLARMNGAMPDQRSTSEQMADVLTAATLLGLYDAADVIKRWLGRIDPTQRESDLESALADLAECQLATVRVAKHELTRHRAIAERAVERCRVLGVKPGPRDVLLAQALRSEGDGDA